MGGRFYVYEHWRPDREECFYVGKGCGRRANDMRRGRNRFHKYIQKKLASLGMCVEVRIVADGLEEDDAFFTEIRRIAMWRADGVDLANRTDGGEGSSGYVCTDELKEIRRKASTGRKHTPEARAKMSAAAMGRSVGRRFKKSPEAVERTAAASRGKPKSEETKRKISETKLANPTLKGRKLSPKHREALRASKVGWAPSEETRAKLRVANLGKTHTPEVRARLSETGKADWVRRRALKAAISMKGN